MVRTPSGNVAGRQERRLEEILQAAGEVFVRKGYIAATTRDIAEQVRIQPGSLYYYIASKEAALVEICRRVGRQFTRNMDDLLARDEPVDSLIRAGIVTHLANNRAHLVFHFVFSPRELPASVRKELARLSRAYQKQWEELLERGVRSGRLRDDLDPRTAAIALLAMCNGAVEWYQHKTPAAVAAIAEGFATLYLGGMRRPP